MKRRCLIRVDQKGLNIREEVKKGDSFRSPETHLPTSCTVGKGVSGVASGFFKK